tara:strand:+ start:4001 stop:4285 length:285 start_codon:yes stop_codon:yes gene_type:complete
MAYKSNWHSDKISIVDVIEHLKADMINYTNNVFTVVKHRDDGGLHIAVYTEVHADGSSPYHRQITANYMGWRCCWFKCPHGTVTDMLEDNDESA